MLKQRIITGLTLSAMMLIVIFYFPLYGVALFFGIFAVGAVWEWSRLSGIVSVPARLMYTLTLTVAGVIFYYDMASGTSELTDVLLFMAVAWWLYVLVIELMINQDKEQGLLKSPYGKLVAGSLIILPGWASAVYLQSISSYLSAGLLFMLLLVGLSDTAAFFVGRSLGRHKLAPKISPGKTIEGLVGGLVAVALMAVLFGRYVWTWSWPDIAILVAISLVAALFGVVGDLIESRIKRLAGVKDSGSMLPGHGGFMDRTDAFFAAAPVLTVSLIQYGKVVGKW